MVVFGGERSTENGSVTHQACNQPRDAEHREWGSQLEKVTHVEVGLI